jgi:hypothetical protein
LEKLYGCTFVGEMTPLAFSLDDGPDMFKSPQHDEDNDEEDGFCVPQPTAPGGFYEQWVIDRVINDNNLKPIKTAYVTTTGKPEPKKP